MKYLYNLTVIVPCYNCCKYVKKTINSLLEQDYDLQKIEILLINDGSTDNTLKIIKKYESKNIKVVDKKNEGVSATRNLGMKMSKGKYILFLDSDDYLSRNTIRDIINFFDAHYDEIDLLTYPMLYFYPSGRTMRHSRYKKLYINGTNVYDLDEFYYLIQPTLNVCIKNGLGYEFDVNQYYAEDEMFNIKILMNKKKIGFVKEGLYYYRRHNESTTANRYHMNLENIYSFYEKYQQIYKNDKYIQATIMNNLNWRIREDCLIPPDKESINSCIESIRRKLSIIDFSLFKDHVLDNKKVLLELLSLSQKKCIMEKYDDKYSLISDGKVLINNIDTTNINIRLNRICKEKDNITLYGYLITPLFYTGKIKLFSKIEYRNGKCETKKIDLYNILDYQENYKKEYKLCLKCDKISEISFYCELEKEKILLDIKPIDWCSKVKIYDDSIVEINNNIKIYKKKLFDKFKTRFFYSSNKFKFKLINLVSFITRKGSKYHVYFGDKNSLIYQEYIDDKNHKKLFYDRAFGTNYKFVILNCDKIITNKSIKLVLPFGKMRKNYVQASHFEIILKDN